MIPFACLEKKIPQHSWLLEIFFPFPWFSSTQISKYKRLETNHFVIVWTINKGEKKKSCKYVKKSYKPSLNVTF